MPTVGLYGLATYLVGSYLGAKAMGWKNEEAAQTAAPKAMPPVKPQEEISTNPETDAQDAALLAEYSYALSSQNPPPLVPAVPESHAWWTIQNAHQDDIVELAQAFIKNYPDSEHVPGLRLMIAYLKNGEEALISNRFNYEELIADYEEIISLYPGTAEAADAAFGIVIVLWGIPGREEELVCYAQSWLDQYDLEPYELDREVAFGFHYKDGEEKRRIVLVTQAQAYELLGEKEKALQCYREVGEGGGEYPRIAQGAVSVLAGETKIAAEPAYYDFIARGSGIRALFSYYHEGNPEQTRNLYLQALDYASRGDESLLLERELCVEFEALNLPDKVKQSTDVAGVLAELTEQGMILEMAEYYGYHISDAYLTGITEEVALTVVLLGEAKDVLETRFVVVAGGVQYNEEVKTYRKTSAVAFRTEAGWQLFDPQNRRLHARQNFASIEELEAKLEMETGQNAYSHPCPVCSLFERAQAGSDLISHELREELAKASSRSLAKVEGDPGVTIIGGDNYPERAAYFYEAQLLLPPSHLRGLRGVDLNLDEEGLCGEFNPTLGQIAVGCVDFETVVHELAHFWDGVNWGVGGIDVAPGDISLLYYAISWESVDVASCGRDGQICGLWSLRPDADIHDFADHNKGVHPFGYGGLDGYEDKATSFTEYVANTGALSRQEVRRQMLQGNFEPAAKYLFNKYIEAFDPRDGLCYEYGVSTEDPPLTFEEVESMMAQWLEKNPGSISENTINSIATYKRIYQNARARVRQPNFALRDSGFQDTETDML